MDCHNSAHKLLVNYMKALTFQYVTDVAVNLVSLVLSSLAHFPVAFCTAGGRKLGEGWAWN